MEAPGFWDNPDYSNKKMKELKNLKDTVDQIGGLQTRYEDIETLIEMGNEEEDESMAEEIRGELDSFAQELETLRISTLLTGEYDKNDAILKLNAGGGRHGKLRLVRHALPHVYQMGREKGLPGGGSGLSGRR